MEVERISFVFSEKPNFIFLYAFLKNLTLNIFCNYDKL